MNLTLGALTFVVAASGVAVVIVLVTLRYRLDLLIRQAREANRLLQASLRELRTVEHRLSSRTEPEFGRVDNATPGGVQHHGSPSWKWSSNPEDGEAVAEAGSTLPSKVSEPRQPAGVKGPAPEEERPNIALDAGQRRSEILASIRDPEITGDELTLLYEELRQLNREHRAWINSRMRPDLRRSL